MDRRDEGSEEDASEADGDAMSFVRSLSPAHREEWEREKTRRMVTYFIWCDATGLVKIGMTSNLVSRLNNLSSAVPVSLLGTLPGDRERDLHGRFAASRIYREWFAPTEDLVTFICSLESKACNEETVRNLAAEARPHISMACPFCKATKVHEIGATNGSRMKCSECGALGPRGRDGDNARWRWSHRPWIDRRAPSHTEAVDGLPMEINE